ncbi:NAD(P)H-dependent flavin oxidoreductase [Thermodesulfobacteriota bacterium]
MEKNRICDLLGIRYPIIQAPMNWVSGADLAAAVSSVGGLGTLGPNAGADSITPDVELTGERMRDQIRRLRSITRKPFAVNIAVGYGEQLKFSRKMAAVVIEEEVPVAIVSVGRPDIYTKTLKDAGIKVFHAISTARHAKVAEQAGVDGVICEGFEAGGHKGFTELTTFVLVPLVADAVQIPVVAGGGIADARGVLAALALGADGVYMGTRFMAAKESESHPRVKELIVRGEDACTVSLPKDIMLARDLSNDFTGKYLEMKQAGASLEDLKNFSNNHSQFHAQHLGQAENAEICCGQAAGLITGIPQADEIVADIVDSIKSRFEEIQGKVNDFF